MEKPSYSNSDGEALESVEGVTVIPGLSSSEGISKLPLETRPFALRDLDLGKAIRRLWVVFLLITYLIGLGSGFMLWGRNEAQGKHPDQADMDMLAAQINPVGGYELPARYGNIGPGLLEVGAINMNEFLNIYQENGKPLSADQIAILTTGSMAPIIINQDNQHFLLNLFWAFGLANQNLILTEGPMMRNGEEVVNFASTGGWSLADRPIAELYASTSIINLTEEQQERLEEVALGVYRPCCNNPTHFPDCNHGMAMLGLLELMASQGAGIDEMFEAAKYVNAYWFPQQTLEVAMAYQSLEKDDFETASARQLVGREMMSGSGFQAVHQWLVQNGKLQQAPQGGGSCGVR